MEVDFHTSSPANRVPPPPHLVPRRRTVIGCCPPGEFNLLNQSLGSLMKARFRNPSPHFPPLRISRGCHDSSMDIDSHGFLTRTHRITRTRAYVIPVHNTCCTVGLCESRSRERPLYSPLFKNNLTMDDPCNGITTVRTFFEKLHESAVAVNRYNPGDRSA